MRGWIRVVPYNDPRLSLLSRLPTWWLRGAGGARAGRIESAKAHGAEIVAKIAGVDDRDAAFALVGFEVLLSRAQFPAPDDDEVYWADLIGCTVLDPDGESLGVVVAIEDQPAHPLMRVAEPAGQPLHPGEARAAQARTDDARPDDGRTDEERMSAGRMGEGRMSEGRMGEGRMGEGRMGEGRMSEGRMGEGRAAEARTGEARAAEASPPERLIPLVPEFLLSIDLANRVVVADWRRDY